MKKINLIISSVFLCLFINIVNAQETSDMFYATMETKDAFELQKDHPEDIQIIESKNGYSAVMLSDEAAHELHHKVLVHGPGFIYQSSKKKALSSIQQRRLSQKLAGGFSITQDQLVLQSLDLVNNLNIANQIQELENYGTRYHTKSNATQAVLDLQTKWENLAAGRSDVSVRIVNHTSTNMPSVVMTITGTDNPDEFVIIGGHIDSTSGGNNDDAPGADDNASGIATITEAARVLFEMNFRPKRTMEFMAFAAEEVGLRGSKEIAEDYRSRNVNVVSYMQLDMTNYKGSTNDVYVSTDSYNDETLNDFLIELMDYYNASGAHQITYGTSRCNYGCSDHYSWAQEGYDVTFPFEATFNQSNPNIHTTRDTFDRSPTPNATHAAKFCKLALEYLIEIGNGVNTGGGGDECNISITSFPNTESFEGSIGAWTQSTTEDLNWTVDSNGTPSNGTGPAAAAAGSSYIFVEASGNGTGFPNKRAILNSPCYDLGGLTNPGISFKYHMEGSAIGNLSLDLSTDNGANWTSLFSKSGSQGSDWNTADIDLGAYNGIGIQIRFNTVTGSSWQGDVAIDDFIIGETGSDPNPDVCVALDFNTYAITAFSNQDSVGDFTVVNSGAGVSMENNTWKYILLDYTVTSSTVLEFDFSSSSEGEIHGIGFENDNTLTSSRYFKVHGTQNYGVTNYDNYSGGTASYVIPVGDFYTGAMDRLVFVNDNDAGSGNTSIFSNVKIYEGSCNRAASSVIAFGTKTPVLGDEDELGTSMVTITPNPTKDSFTLNVIGATNKNITATIYTILGKKASSIQLNHGVNTISASNLSLGSGIYLIKVEGAGEKLAVRKLVIQ
ncbi:Por secretion system C-terminal sorting domain-containing protein [Aquimarina amphilecti]|uniref:Por secretion system C-terminal sorting domain-containing protein n=1 Tax=Aquimarina amphilecti TaxID=1038014 RepID=A0A1H7UUC0_AQUAM|nr:M20/M25/M40 family metallo-hydrolase [Aquimarina amphilecti]SEM00238.1 Por secretion system C-terminal sorting domain-containing protein [Aquimarina amphilecti]